MNKMLVIVAVFESALTLIIFIYNFPDAKGTSRTVIPNLAQDIKPAAETVSRILSYCHQYNTFSWPVRTYNSSSQTPPQQSTPLP